MKTEMLGSLNALATEALEDRGLDVELVSRMGVVSVAPPPRESANGGNDDAPREWQFTGPAVARSHWIGIPVMKNGQIVTWKYRTIVGDKRFAQEAGRPKCFFNHDAITDPTLAQMPLYIWEGELDCIAAIQCGLTRSVSVPDGAPAQQIKDEHSTKYQHLDDADAELHTVKHIVIGADGDQPGANLLHDLSIRLGRSRCQWLTYPKGTKDIGDVLRLFGPQAVQETARRARWIKVTGLYKMSELPPPPQRFSADVLPKNLNGYWKPRLGDFVVITGVPSNGKALALDTPLPTPTGWTSMGDVMPGDTLLDENGKPCRVVLATPVMHDHECYRVTFDDGSEIIADADHLWFTTTEKARRSERVARKNGRDVCREAKPRGTDQTHKRAWPGVVTTKEIAATIVSQGKYNHQVPTCKPIDLPDFQLPIPPYVLGAWLGDGSSASGSFTTYDHEIVQRITHEGYVVTYTNTTGNATIQGLVGELRAIGVLNKKHIPAQYLRAGFSQRLELLRGLMDTDGYAAKQGYCEFTSVIDELAYQVHELACSLGIKATISEGRSTLNGRDCGPKYRVQFTTELPVFHMHRKLEAQKCARPWRVNCRTIVSCEPVPSVPVRCIQVDSPSHLYLCGRSFIPTHNTTFLNYICGMLAEQHGWRTCFASFEQNPQTDHKQNLRRFKIGANRYHQGPGDKEIADKWIDDYFTFIVRPQDDEADDGDDRLTLDWVLERAAAAVLRHFTQVLVIDPWNELDHEYGDTETKYIEGAIKKLKRFATRMNILLIVVAHPAKLQPNRQGVIEPPNLYQISGSAHWYNKADIGLVLHRLDTNSLLKVEKARYEGDNGRRGQIEMWLDQNTGRYSFEPPGNPQGEF